MRQILSWIERPIVSIYLTTDTPHPPGAAVLAVAVLPLLGWLGLGGRLGLFATLWFAGFLTMVALFARPENFYWVQLTLPALFAGFAFVPRALADLASAIRAAPKA